MSVKSDGSFASGVALITESGFEPGAATLTAPRRLSGSFHNTEFAFLHEPGLPPQQTPVNFKRRHYRPPGGVLKLR